MKPIEFRCSLDGAVVALPHVLAIRILVGRAHAARIVSSARSSVTSGMTRARLAGPSKRRSLGGTSRASCQNPRVPLNHASKTHPFQESRRRQTAPSPRRSGRDSARHAARNGCEGHRRTRRALSRRDGHWRIRAREGHLASAPRRRLRGRRRRDDLVRLAPAGGPSAHQVRSAKLHASLALHGVRYLRAWPTRVVTQSRAT